MSNSLCQFWNDKSIPLQILYPSSVSWKITLLYFFSSNNIYFVQKEPIKVKIFDWDFRVLISKFVKFLMPILKQVSSSPNFVSLFSLMKDNSSVFFLAETIHTLLKRSLLKWKFLRLSSAQVKICQIPYANFETTSRFLSKFCIPLQFHER